MTPDLLGASQLPPPPPMPSMSSYVRPALTSAAAAGAGWGVGYIVGSVASAGLLRHPSVSRKILRGGPAARSQVLGEIAGVASKATGIATGLGNMAAEGYRREMLWKEWAEKTGRLPPQQVQDHFQQKHAAMVCCLRALGER